MNLPTSDEETSFVLLNSLLEKMVQIGTDFLPASYAVHDEAMTVFYVKTGITTACEKGCSTCCDDFLYLTDMEFAYILEGIKILDPRQRYWMEKMILKSMAEYRQTFRAVIIRMKKFQGETGVCPFLYKHECMIYEYRPHSCRTLHCLNRDKCNDGWDDHLETLCDKWLYRVIRDHPENQNNYPHGIAPLAHFLCGEFEE